MKKLTVVSLLLATWVVAASAAGVVASDAASAPKTASHRIVRLSAASLDGLLPEDLIHPEGRTRWDLTTLHTGATWTRTVTISDAAVEQLDASGTESPASTRYLDPRGGDAATRWLSADRVEGALWTGARDSYEIVRQGGGLEERLWVDSEILGPGWVHLPSGPREAALQRVLLYRQMPGGQGFAPDRLIHRWISPLSGVVAEVSGPSSPDGRTRTVVSDAWVLDSVLSGDSLLKIYANELWGGTFQDISYGWDRGKGTPVYVLTTPPLPLNSTVGALIAASSWDFSGNGVRHAVSGTTTANAATTINGVGTQFVNQLRGGDNISLSSAPTTYGRITAINSATQLTVATPLGNGTTQTIFRKSAEVAATTTNVTAAETCNSTQCGYTDPGGVLERTDKNFDLPVSLDKINAVAKREDRVGDVTIWLRAGSQHEGRTGSFGSGESRFCYLSSDVTRTPVPLWRFPHNDATGWYMQPGDTWASTPAFNCEKDVFNQTCGANQAFPEIWLKACTGGGGHGGNQTGEVIKGGVITVPSGHTFNSLLIRNVADFCIYLGASCFSPSDYVKTVNYLWQVPHMSTVARIQSQQNAPDTTSFDYVDETNIGFGLFPPRTITVTGSTDTTVSLSWDPGLDTHRINGYRVYWDTDPGASTPYAFNSVANPGQVSFAGATATVSGLTVGTHYYFTVTSTSIYTDPSTSVATTYESLRYPTQVFGDPSFVYPIEVQATTTGGSCVPTIEVTNLLVMKASGGNVQFCWNPSSDTCLSGYRVLGSNNATTDVGWSTVADTGLTTCWAGNPSQIFYLVVARGAGGTGPWGHYGH